HAARRLGDRARGPRRARLGHRGRPQPGDVHVAGPRPRRTRLRRVPSWRHRIGGPGAGLALQAARGGGGRERHPPGGAPARRPLLPGLEGVRGRQARTPAARRSRAPRRGRARGPPYRAVHVRVGRVQGRPVGVDRVHVPVARPARRGLLARAPPGAAPDRHPGVRGVALMEKLVIVPTYNERENIDPLLDHLLGLPYGLDVLVVDDGSPDGTADQVKQWQAKTPRVHLIQRPGKMGLGSAYRDGFRYALANGAELVFEMDADFSHDPAAIGDFLEAAKDADIVLGSRYLHGVTVVNWPLSRLILSFSANLYTRII